MQPPKIGIFSFNPLPPSRTGETADFWSPEHSPTVSIHSRRLGREKLLTLVVTAHAQNVSIHSRRLGREKLDDPKTLRLAKKFQSTPAV